MRNLIIAFLLFCAGASTAAGLPAGELSLRVRLTTGEHSRDSSSQTTTISIAPDAGKIVWERIFSGRRHGTPAEAKEFKLSPADRAGLIKLIRDRNLLVTKSIELPQDGAGFMYFALSIDLAVNGKKGAISISGPRTASKVKGDQLYQSTQALVSEIYRIIHTQDKTVYFEELVR